MIPLLIIAILVVAVYKAKFRIVETAISYIKKLFCNGTDNQG